MLTLGEARDKGVWKMSSSSSPEWDTKGLEVDNLMQTPGTILGTN